MAAAANPLHNLQEEALCPICLDHLTDPVITPCGHNFCRPCIKACSEGPGAPFCCPQCREPCSRADLRPNRQLQNMVELVRQLSTKPEGPPRGEGVCAQHEEKLKLFCQDDKKMICVICQVSREHEKHAVRPINEAAQEYQVKLQNWLPPLKKEREAIVVSKRNEVEEYKSMRKNLEEEKTKTAAEFERLRQQLVEQEQAILTRLEEMNRKITMVENSNIAKLSSQISSLDALIKEIASKCKQPPGELLKDVGLTLSRCEKVKFRGPEPIKKEKKKKNAQRNINSLKLEEVKRYKERVTLDPESAKQSLVLSENKSRVRNSGAQQPFNKQEFWYENSRKFSASPCVLGREGFHSGRHYWEVEFLQEGQGWTVGVAEESMDRNFITQPPQKQAQKKTPFRLFDFCEPTESPLGGVWALHMDNGEYVALTLPCTVLSIHHPIRVLGVYLDYEAGQVSLYNGGTKEVLYTFSGADFNGSVHPYFNLCGTSTVHFGRVQPLLTDLRLF